MKRLREYIRAVRATRHERKLWVFDFDDTLVRTDACTHVITATGDKFDLTSSEYVAYEKQPGDTFDYADFEKLTNPRAVKWVNRILHNVHAHHGSAAIVVLSARSYDVPIKQYLCHAGLSDVEVVVLDATLPGAKATWVSARIERDRLTAIEFFDDSHKNVAAVSDLRCRHPEVSIVARHIVHNRIGDSLVVNGDAVTE